jgi:hypothetical protein
MYQACHFHKKTVMFDLHEQNCFDSLYNSSIVVANSKGVTPSMLISFDIIAAGLILFSDCPSVINDSKAVINRSNTSESS